MKYVAMTLRSAHIALLFFVLLSLTAQAQVWEDFSDGDFTHNPTWTGDTADFRVNSNNQLQLFSEVSEVSLSQLLFHFAMPRTDTISWEFWIKFGYSPSVNNMAMVALYSNIDDLPYSSQYLALAILDRYSDSHKRIALYQDTERLFFCGNSLTRTPLSLRMKVLLINKSTVEVWGDTVCSGIVPHYVFLGGGQLIEGTSIPDSAFFGWCCMYTPSRGDRFYLDDIGINRTLPPLPVVYSLHSGDVVVNEVLFNPTTGGADYVEIYNRTDSVIPLNDLRLARFDGESVSRLYPFANEGMLMPHDYAVVTTDRQFVASNYTVQQPSKLFEVSAMPSYPDAAGTVMLTKPDTAVLDRFDYSASMHSNLLNDVEGVALERRSPDAATNDANNWYSASSLSGFGTPTAKNSQSHEFLFVDNDFTVEPTLFSPDGDGYNDLTNIAYSLNNCDLSCDITVFDARGRLVRHLTRAALLGCEGVVAWDGTDDAGSRCARGNYMIVVDAYNAAGRRQQLHRRVSLVIN